VGRWLARVPVPATLRAKMPVLALVPSLAAQVPAPRVALAAGRA
jgi:hypothetical protein